MEHCNDKTSFNPLSVETDIAIYEVTFGQVEIEITGRCNMLCQHCRAGESGNVDMAVGEIIE